MKKILNVMALLAIVLIMSFCTDAQMSRVGGFGNEFKVEMINCDGSISHSWISSGKVSSEANSDGYFFMDKKTGKLIEVTGRMIITSLN